MEATQNDQTAIPVGSSPGAQQTNYQLLLASLVFPISAHIAVNMLAAVSILLIGHPVTAAVFLGTASLIDAIQQRLVKRWIARSAATDPDVGMHRLAVMCAVRTSVYIAPTVTMVIVTQGLAELAFFAIQFATLLTLALGAGVLSRLIFWSFCAPIMIAAAVLISALFTPVHMFAIGLGLLTLLVMLLLTSESTTRAIATWHAAFRSNVALVVDLATARDLARTANNAKSNFLATMSHEIRTPMNGVLGMAQLLKRDAVDPVQGQRIDVLIESGEYLLAILDDILDVSKIDAGKLQLVPAPENVAGLLEKLVGFWAARADEAGVALTLQIAPGVPDQVMVDALRLRQVLFNLVGNALKFTEHGSVEIIAEAADRGGGMVDLHLAIKDTGPGIAEHHLAFLFDRFSQVEDAEARRFGGTGLGLAIVKQLTELMDGRVWVESVPGTGSTFHIQIPLRVITAAAEDTLSAVSSDLPAEALHLLAVDDNATNLLVLDQLLSSLGHRVAKALSGAQALEILASQAFDLVLTDIQMPEMTGTELLQQLRSEPGPNRDVPVLALTADVTSGGRQHYLDLGFTEHAAKPIQLEGLLEAVARALVADRPASLGSGGLKHGLV